MTETSRGTSSYRAPELLDEFPTFSDRVDIWALGCILYETALKRKAFSSDWAIREYAVMKQKLLISLEDITESHTRMPLINLIHEMLQLNSKSRPSAQELYALFNVLTNSGSNTSILESDNLLLLKICQPFSSDDSLNYESTNSIT